MTSPPSRVTSHTVDRFAMLQLIRRQVNWRRVSCTHGVLLAMAFAIRLQAQVTSSRSAEAGQSRFATLERTIAAEMLTKGIPGVAVVVVEGGRATYRRAFGIADVERGTPMAAELLAQVGSVTKVVTALLAGEMANRGEVDLDAPIAKYVSGLGARIGALTLRQLLTQTSGLRDESADSGRQDESALLEYARTVPDSAIRLPAGEAFSYSNLGFALGGLALQEAAHRPYAQLAQERVLRAMLMGEATFRPMDAMTFPRAAGHAPDSTGRLQVVRPVANDTRYWPAGYLWASADDLALLLRLLMHGRLDVEAPPSLAAAVDSMLVSRTAVPGMPFDAHYGYGMFLDSWHGARRAWHPGEMPGYSTLIEFLPDQRIGVVVTANRDGIRLDKIAETALETLVALPGESETRAQGASPGATAPPGLEGTYVARFPLELHYRDGRLLLRRFGNELPVTPLGGTRFSVQAAGAPAPDVFRIVPATSRHPAYIQMFLWAFPRVQ